MIHTVGEARTYVNDVVKGGRCSTSSEVLDAINSATMRLIDVDDWHLTLRKIMICVQNNFVPLPREVAALRAVTLDRYPKRVMHEFYQFLESGPGINDSTAGNKLLHHQGSYHPVYYQPDCRHPGKLCAISTEEETSGLVLTIRGRDALRGEIIQDSEIGEELGISRWKGGVEGQWPQAPALTANDFYYVTQVNKPVTKGYVSLYVVGSDGRPTHFLAKYHPRETSPNYAWYRVTNHDTTNGDALIGMAKLAYVPAVADTDWLLINNLQALRAEVEAIEYERRHDEGRAENAHLRAVRALRIQLANFNHDGPKLEVETQAYGLSDISLIR